MPRDEYPKTEHDLANIEHSTLALAKGIVAVDPAGTAIEPTDDSSVAGSAARTATFNQADQTNRAHRGIMVFVRPTTGDSSGPTLTPKIEAKDPNSGQYFDLLGAAAIAASTGASLNGYILYPGHLSTGAIGDVIRTVPTVLPRVYRITVSQSTTRSRTYSIGRSLLL